MMNIVSFIQMIIFIALVIVEMCVFPHMKNSCKHKNIFRVIFGITALFICYWEVRYMKKMYFNYKYKIYPLRIGTTIIYNIMLIACASSIVYAIKSSSSSDNNNRKKSSKYLSIFKISLIIFIVSGIYSFLPVNNDGSRGSYIMVMIMFLILALIVFIGFYVYHDAKKRGMDAFMWTIISVFIPYFIGFLIYIIARGENKKRCPVCGRPVDYQYKVCPFCGTELKHKCPYCGKDVSPDWNICPYCSNKLK